MQQPRDVDHLHHKFTGLPRLKIDLDRELRSGFLFSHFLWSGYFNPRELRELRETTFTVTHRELGIPRILCISNSKQGSGDKE